MFTRWSDAVGVNDARIRNGVIEVFLDSGNDLRTA